MERNKPERADGGKFKAYQRKLKVTIFEYFMITLAAFLLIIGVHFFKFPNHFSFGGVTGIAVVVSAVTPFSMGTINFVINTALLALGFAALGRDFGIKTVYVSFLISFGLSGMERVFPISEPLTQEPVLELIFAIVLPAVSSAILFNIGASGGGTDIVAMVLKKHSTVNIGTALFLVDLLITVAACFIFDIQTGLFSFCGLLAKSLVIDSAIENINLCKYFTIVCDDPDLICEFIHENLTRSATIFKAEGTFTHHRKYVILTVMKRGQAVQLRNFIKVNEPSAFMMITNSSEIIGKGFRGLN